MTPVAEEETKGGAGGDSSSGACTAEIGYASQSQRSTLLGTCQVAYSFVAGHQTARPASTSFASGDHLILGLFSAGLLGSHFSMRLRSRMDTNSRASKWGIDTGSIHVDGVDIIHCDDRAVGGQAETRKQSQWEWIL
jgi:hypothetical protein